MTTQIDIIHHDAKNLHLKRYVLSESSHKPLLHKTENYTHIFL